MPVARGRSPNDDRRVVPALHSGWPSVREESPMPTSDDLMRLARACANRITPPRKSRQFPSFSEVEEQCEEEYEELLGVLHDDEIYQPADLSIQEQLVEAIRAALPEIRHVLVEDL